MGALLCDECRSRRYAVWEGRKGQRRLPAPDLTELLQANFNRIVSSAREDDGRVAVKGLRGRKEQCARTLLDQCRHLKRPPRCFQQFAVISDTGSSTAHNSRRLQCLRQFFWGSSITKQPRNHPRGTSCATALLVPVGQPILQECFIFPKQHRLY